MAEMPRKFVKLKRKTRRRGSLEAVSPDGKRIWEVSNKEVKEVESTADGKLLFSNFNK